DPRAVMGGSRMLEGLITEVVIDELGSAGGIENGGGALDLDSSARMHGDGGGARVQHAHEPFRAGAVARAHDMEIGRELGMQRFSRLEAGTAWLAARGELDAVRRESVQDELRSRDIGAFVAFEHGEYDGAHVSPSPSRVEWRSMEAYYSRWGRWE